ncbi:MAG TPA: ABC transporter permease [Ornithinimicrobium sp.]|uniref:ABC transporter permease n=1 Tax=Ornithinimicrobium sp. TaxID=1977084 RepID=UPI002B47D279|nr:ABC transporter permease [Ornithinimicrobium sp.]HKJ11347.1 ABC transporter permease [Ornithinimicrobium sp.]
MRTAIPALVTTEIRLFLREPVSLVFVVAFPALVVLVMGGVFDPNDPTFAGVTPAAYYTAAYFAVVLAALGLIMLPAHLASYHQAGVLRRFHASHFPAWALPAAWAVVAVLMALVGFAVTLATAFLSYGVPAVQHPWATAGAIGLSTFMFINVGLFLGLVLPTSRAADAVGLTLFFPLFLLSGSGPPPAAMPEVMRTISDALPMTQSIRSIQSAWLGIGTVEPGGWVMLVTVSALALGGWLVMARRIADD